MREVLIQNEVDGLVNALTEERERYWMTPDMTKKEPRRAIEVRHL